MCDPDPRAGDFEPAKGFAPDCGGDVIAACAVAPGAPGDARSSIALVIVATVAAVRRRRR
jgi:MYXO-CTERM domain-containing protein